MQLYQKGNAACFIPIPQGLLFPQSTQFCSKATRQCSWMRLPNSHPSWHSQHLYENFTTLFSAHCCLLTRQGKEDSRVERTKSVSQGASVHHGAGSMKSRYNTAWFWLCRSSTEKSPEEPELHHLQYRPVQHLLWECLPERENRIWALCCLS